MPDIETIIRNAITSEGEKHPSLLSNHPSIQTQLNKIKDQTILITIIDETKKLFHQLNQLVGTEADKLSTIELQLAIDDIVTQQLSEIDDDDYGDPSALKTTLWSNKKNQAAHLVSIDFPEQQRCIIKENFEQICEHQKTIADDKLILNDEPVFIKNHRFKNNTYDADQSLRVLDTHLTIIRQLSIHLQKSKRSSEELKDRWQYHLDSPTTEIPTQKKLFLLYVIHSAYGYAMKLTELKHTVNQANRCITLVLNYQMLELSLFATPQHNWEATLAQLKIDGIAIHKRSLLPQVTQKLIGTRQESLNAAKLTDRNTSQVDTDETLKINVAESHFHNATQALEHFSNDSNAFHSLAQELGFSVEQLDAWMHYHFLPIICLNSTNNVIESHRLSATKKLAEYYAFRQDHKTPVDAFHQRMLLLIQVLICKDSTAVMQLYELLKLVETQFILEENNRNIESDIASLELSVFYLGYNTKLSPFGLTLSSQKQAKEITRFYNSLEGTITSETKNIDSFEQSIRFIESMRHIFKDEKTLLLPWLRQRTPNAEALLSQKNLGTLYNSIIRDNTIDETAKRKLMRALCKMTSAPEESTLELKDANFSSITDTDYPHLNTVIYCLGKNILSKDQLARYKPRFPNEVNLVEDHYIKPIVYTAAERMGLIQQWNRNKRNTATYESPEPTKQPLKIRSSIRQKLKEEARDAQANGSLPTARRLFCTPQKRRSSSPPPPPNSHIDRTKRNSSTPPRSSSRSPVRSSTATALHTLSPNYSPIRRRDESDYNSNSGKQTTLHDLIRTPKGTERKKGIRLFEPTGLTPPENNIPLLSPIRKRPGSLRYNITRSDSNQGNEEKGVEFQSSSAQRKSIL